MITVARSLRSTPSGIIRALWAAGGSPNSRGKNHFEFLIEKFKGTNRLIVIDNAQLLSKSGLGFVFDFHDETGSPIALVGNPEIIKRISSNDQQFSRIGVHWKIEPPLDHMEVPTRKTIHQWFPEHVDELYRLARQVAVQMGHLRALKKQLRLAREIMTNQPDISPTTAFRSAHTMLIRNYKLKD
jgi:DNA transposition AAA+ family ATPase